MGKRYERIIRKITKIDCMGFHSDLLGFTNMIAKKGEPIVCVTENGEDVDTGERVEILDYDEFDLDAKIINDKYIVYPLKE